MKWVCKGQFDIVCKLFIYIHLFWGFKRNEGNPLEESTLLHVEILQYSNCPLLSIIRILCGARDGYVIFLFLSPYYKLICNVKFVVWGFLLG